MGTARFDQHRAAQRGKRPRRRSSGYSGPPEKAQGTTFVCALPGCEGVNTRRRSGGGVYCSRECGYEAKRMRQMWVEPSTIQGGKS